MSSEPPKINEHFAAQIQRCVVFIGIKQKGKFKPKATGFIVAIEDHQLGWRYLVTADHVISALKSQGHEIWLRTNEKDGTASESNWSDAEWMFHPDAGSTDVAISAIGFDSSSDFLALPLSPMVGADRSMAGTESILKKYWVHPGQEVMVTGLFRSHYGQQRNVPIIRTGNIAMMLGEKVYTQHCHYTDAYLIEARSIGGLSGSPVFIRLERRLGLQVTGENLFLLGLMHGHFDVQNMKDDVVVDDDNGHSGINTGIGIVIPVEKILETIYQPELVQMRKKSAEEFKDANSTSPVITSENNAQSAASVCSNRP